MKDSPGYRRLVQRRGSDAYEAMIQDTLRRQQEALEGVAKARPQGEPPKPMRPASRRDGQEKNKIPRRG